MGERSEASTGVTVLVMADPGQCAARARAVAEQFEQELASVYGAATVHVLTQFLGVSDTDTLEFGAISSLREGYEGIDAVLVLTEMPRRSHGKPEMATVFRREAAAVMSLPTLGVLAGRRRLVALFMTCVLRLVDDAPSEARERYELRWNQWREPHGEAPAVLLANTVTGVPRTVMGMVATNAPWRTAPHLSTALAAASAVGAFGIFYQSIWEMSAALSTGRLAMIGLLAVSLMVLWLLLSNGLWERGGGRAGPAEMLVYYNLSTLMTLFLVVVGLYLALFVVILGASLVVIDPDFMAEIMGGPVSFSNYVDLAWLSAAMGAVAGGLGTSFDAHTDIRQVTHGRREVQRRPGSDTPSGR